MKRATNIAAALCLGVIAAAHVRAAEPAAFTQGTPVVVVGQVSSPPKGEVNEQKMQVAVGPNRTDYTLHFRNAELFGLSGQKIDEDGFDNRQWVRAEGRVMNDPRRIEVHRVQVIAPDQGAYAQSAFYRPTFSHGYVVGNTDPIVTVTTPKMFGQGTPVVVVGRISSAPKGEVNEQKMQVALGPDNTDYTLHFKDAMLFGMNGQKIDEDGLDNGQWVRAEGTVMDDPRRIRVSRVEVIAPDQGGLSKSAYYRSDYGHGYVQSVAGSRQYFPAVQTPTFAAAPMTIVGQVSDDTGSFESTRRIQVKAAGNEWTLHVPKEAGVTDAKGEKLSVHEIKEGQWVRATGTQTDDLRMHVTGLQNLGASEAFGTSTYYRKDYPLGYVERMGQRSEFNGTDAPAVLVGTVTTVGPDHSFFVIRDRNGDEQVVAMSGMTTMNAAGTVQNIQFRPGTEVIIMERTIRVYELPRR